MTASLLGACGSHTAQNGSSNPSKNTSQQNSAPKKKQQDSSAASKRNQTNSAGNSTSSSNSASGSTGTHTQSGNGSSNSSGTTSQGSTTQNSTGNSSSSSQGSSAQGNTTTSSTIQVVTDPTSITVLVNKTHKLPDGYVPPHLVYPNVAFPYSAKVEKREMRAVAAHALEKMFAAATKDGIPLYAQSGYRSFATQQAIFAYNVKTEGYKQANIVSAHPGTSEHQTGLAMDLTDPEVQDQLIQKFGDTPEGKWVAQHAHEYGFIIRYPKGKESITGYEYEPWHIRYLGVKVATYIYQHHLTLEQYTAEQQTKATANS